jgi:hypothetical protein
MKTKLEEAGWKEVGSYAGCVIYALGNDRLLYNPETDKVEFAYHLTEFVRLL